MEVDGAKRRPIPHRLRKHPERHHDTQIGVPFVEHGMKFWRLQLFWLRKGEAVLDGHFLDCTGLQRSSPTRWPVWCSHHTNDLVPAHEQLLKAGCGKLRRPEKYNPKGA